MKKFFSFFAIAALASALMISCDNGDNGNNPGGEEETAKYRVKTFTITDADETWADVYTYTYGDDGKVTRVVRGTEPDLERDYTFTVSGNTITVNNFDDLYATLTIGEDGYVSSMVMGKTYEYTYDGDGHMSGDVMVDGGKVSTITIADGCISTWTRYSNDEWQTKEHDYLDKKNLGGIHTIYCEGSGPSRWFMETGYFGVASDFVCSSNKWAHSEITSTLGYEYDANGYIIKESKTYDTSVEVWKYTWEEIPE